MNILTIIDDFIEYIEIDNFENVVDYDNDFSYELMEKQFKEFAELRNDYYDDIEEDDIVNILEENEDEIANILETNLEILKKEIRDYEKELAELNNWIN